LNKNFVSIKSKGNVILLKSFSKIYQISEFMAWIKTIPFEEANAKLQKILTETRKNYPLEYAMSAPKASATSESIIDSHTLIPDALYHAFSTFSALMSPDLPLTRRQHEMIATVVSAANDCHY